MKNPFTTTGQDGVEPGIQTTEFWLGFATWALSIADTFGIHHFTQQQDGLVIAGVPIAYMLVRTLLKSTAQIGTSAKTSQMG